MTPREKALKQKSETLWLACKHHVTHLNKDLQFADRRYLPAMYLDDSKYLIVMKSTQCGVSEWLIVNSFTKALKGRSVFYVLPTFQLAGRFVRNRVDRTIAYTPYYASILMQGYKSQSESILLKHFGAGSVAFVGSNTPSVFTEYPADDLIIDELDYCDQDNIMMGWERLSASEDKKEIRVSNPTVEGYGIDEEYANTTQYEWHIKHDCGNYIKPDFFEHVVNKVDEGRFVLRDKEFTWENGEDINMICTSCGKPVDRKAEGVWVAKYSGRSKHGFHISKLFSTNVTIREMVDRFNKGLTNDTILQRFYNADLGVAYTAAGAKIQDNMLDECREDYSMKPPAGKAVCVMGIDVGKLLYVRISELNRDGKMKAVYIGAVHTYENIRDLYRQYKVKIGVVDALPETRLSKRIVSSLRGMFMCYYGAVKKDSIDINNKIITVERTQALDNVKEAILLMNLILPSNARSIPDYYKHMTASTRTFDEKKNTYIWVEGSKDDHFMHAEGYGILARKLLVVLTNR